MKKLIALLLVICMVSALFAACGSSDEETTAAPQASGESTEDKSEDTSGDEAEDPSEEDPSAEDPSAEDPSEDPTESEGDTNIEDEPLPELVGGDFTYNTSTTALATNWNPHTWEMNSDSTVLSYLTMGFVSLSIDDSEEGVYQWVYDMATSIEDVTADNQADLDKYSVTLPEGKTSADVTEGYVYEIKLTPEACWQDGTPINADSYIYSMKQLLDPSMKNYRANLFYSGESAVAGGSKYYYSADEGMYQGYTTKYASLEEAVAAGDVYINCWEFWGAEGYIDADGNECPQYVSITDETAYSADGAGDDEFSGASLYADYGPFLEVGGGYEDYAVVYVLNEDMGYPFEGVGLYKVDDYTIRYVCQTAIEKNYFLTSCTDTWLVYEDVYEAGKETTGDLVTTNYGTSVETTMSYGPYRLESLQIDKQMVLVQNEKWWGWIDDGNGNLVSATNYLVDGERVQQFQTTKIVFDVMDSAASKQAFLKGELSEWTPETEDLLTYATSDQLYRVDETYTMSFFFNTGLEALQEMDRSKGNTNSVVMSNINFRKAFSLAIDREEWVTATSGYKPAYATMNNLYFYDVYNDPTSSYRSSDEAMQAICNLYGVEYGEGTPYATLADAYKSINGYNLTEAQQLMKTACEELVAAGLYKAGEEIHILIGYKAGSLDSSDQQQVALMNKYLNAAAEGSGFGTITLEPIGNINNRYDDTANGEYAIGYGAWGGAAFYPFRYFQVYCDPDQYSLHEAGCWDPTTETLTLLVNGEEVTMTWQEWSGALIGVGAYANESNEVKLSITAQMEEAWLKLYYRIPLASSTACFMLAYKCEYYTEDYNIMYDFGGMRLMSYIYNDAEWADFVASVDGTIAYE